jgi:hypothetical protein
MNVMVLVVEDPGDPLNVTLQDVLDGKPVSLKLTTKVTPVTKFAVMLPGPVIVAVVEDADAFATVIEPVIFHEENTKPEFPSADIGSDPEVSYTFVPEGLVVPAAEGLTAKDTWY